MDDVGHGRIHSAAVRCFGRRRKRNGEEEGRVRGAGVPSREVPRPFGRVCLVPAPEAGPVLVAQGRRGPVCQGTRDPEGAGGHLRSRGRGHRQGAVCLLRQSHGGVRSVQDRQLPRPQLAAGGGEAVPEEEGVRGAHRGGRVGRSLPRGEQVDGGERPVPGGAAWARGRGWGGGRRRRLQVQHHLRKRERPARQRGRGLPPRPREGTVGRQGEGTPGVERPVVCGRRRGRRECGGLGTRAGLRQAECPPRSLQLHRTWEGAFGEEVCRFGAGWGGCLPSGRHGVSSR